MALIIREQWLAKNLAGRRLAARRPANPRLAGPPVDQTPNPARDRATPAQGARRQGGRRQRPPQAHRCRRARPRPARSPQWTTAEIEEAFRRFRAARPRAQGRAQAHQSVYAPGRGGAVRAGDRCRRQQGDAGAVCGRRYARQDGGARRGAGAGADQDHRAVSHQGQERRGPLEEARRGARQRGAAFARGAGGAARRRPQDRQRRPQHRVRRADDRGRHPYFPGRQPDRPGDRQDPVRGRDQARCRWCRRNTSATPTTG